MRASPRSLRSELASVSKGADRAHFRADRAHFRADRAHFRADRAHFRADRAHFRADRAHFRADRAHFRADRAHSAVVLSAQPAPRTLARRAVSPARSQP
ncbi:alanine-zipper protein [Gordonia sp. ABSL11-1]|uniref:alanine-zipper protein n=1 Tax=Gordonia sp. ABSL11-1 TaxID=3053924 RepID=UPI002573E3F0|nr:alanine-zipper protein [Gordonia sp. ABSL11-1]MDL9947102.1 alanine-zipper protein [Gordonia sp. ABSL11-1]